MGCQSFPKRIGSHFFEARADCKRRPLLVGEITAGVTYDVLGAGGNLMVADASRATYIGNHQQRHIICDACCIFTEPGLPSLLGLSFSGFDP